VNSSVLGIDNKLSLRRDTVISLRTSTGLERREGLGSILLRTPPANPEAAVRQTSIHAEDMRYSSN